MRVQLRVLDGPDEGTTFVFEGYNRIVIGRQGGQDRNGRRLGDPFMSRYHFFLETVGDACVIRDLGSRSGLAVNGQRTETCRVHEGDTVRAGHTVFSISIERTTSLTNVTVPGDRSPDEVVRPSLADYEHLEFLAEGGLGMVYKARERVTGRIVAIKMLKQERACEPAVEDHFIREMDLLRSLNHHHIVRVYAAGRDEGRLWLAMEYVDGPTLEEAAEIGGPYSTNAACRFGTQILDALAYGHDRKIVHRDIKPANILLDSLEGRPFVKVADYGLAKSFLDTCSAPLTITGAVKGTLAYMAPEQFLDAKRVGPAADLYSVAGTLYRVLTGRWHYDDGEDRHSRWSLLLEGQYIPLAARRPDAPAALCAAVDSGLSRTPQRRPASALVMKTMLEEALSETE